MKREAIERRLDKNKKKKKNTSNSFKNLRRGTDRGLYNMLRKNIGYVPRSQLIADDPNRNAKARERAWEEWKKSPDRGMWDHLHNKSYGPVPQYSSTSVKRGSVEDRRKSAQPYKKRGGRAY